MVLALHVLYCIQTKQFWGEGGKVIFMLDNKNYPKLQYFKRNYDIWDTGMYISVYQHTNFLANTKRPVLYQGIYYLVLVQAGTVPNTCKLYIVLQNTFTLPVTKRQMLLSTLR